MLRSVRFYSEGDFDFHYRRFYERNRDLFNERTAICPLDMSGGSASLMHYISSHSVGSAQHASSLHDALKLRRDGQVDRIVLLDDALISGTQATHILDQYFRVSSTNRKHVAPLSEEQKQVLMRGDILMLFLMATGIGKAKLTKELRSSYPHLNVQVESIAQMDSRALFKDRTYVFGAMAQEAENLFGNVGHELLANRAAEKEEAAQDRESYRRRNAIGFGNDQLLIVYWYNP